MKMKPIARLGFELPSYNVAVQHRSHNVNGIPSIILILYSRNLKLFVPIKKKMIFKKFINFLKC